MIVPLIGFSPVCLGETGVGLVVYGKTRCYVKRFRVGQGSEPRDDEGVAAVPAVPATARKATTSYGPCPNIMAAGNMVNEDSWHPIQTSVFFGVSCRQYTKNIKIYYFSRCEIEMKLLGHPFLFGAGRFPRRWIWR